MDRGAFFLIHIRGTTERLLHLCTSARFGPSPQLSDQVHRLPRLEPLPVLTCHLTDDPLGDGDLGLPPLEAPIDDLAEIIDIVEEDLALLTDRGIDITGYSDIDEEELSLRAMRKGTIEELSGHDEVRRRCRRRDDLDRSEGRIELVVLDRLTPEP